MWVFLPPLLLVISTFLYLSKIYKTETSIIDIKKDSRPSSNVIFDPLEVRDFLPDSIGQKIKFVLCLKNRNEITLNGQSIDTIPVPNELEDAKKHAGFMAIRASAIPELDLNSEHNKSNCVSIDMEKLMKSTVNSEINNGLTLLTFSDDNIKDIHQGKSTQVAYTRPQFDLSHTQLYTRMQWNYFFFLTIIYYIGWFGLIILFKTIYEFIFDQNKN